MFFGHKRDRKQETLVFGGIHSLCMTQKTPQHLQVQTFLYAPTLEGSYVTDHTWEKILLLTARDEYMV